MNKKLQTFVDRAHQAAAVFDAKPAWHAHGTWHHVAVTRSGSTFRLFVDGALEASYTWSRAGFNNNVPVAIGVGYAQSQNVYQAYYTGYMDELRITKGVARYTAAFTPPTAAFPDAGLPASATLASSINPSTAGQLVTLTATVAGGTSPTGTVTFKDGSAVLASQALASGSASYAVRFAGGTHSLTAVYGGDANNAATTSAAVSQSVGQSASTTTLAASPASASLGQNVTLNATVSGYQPTGTVTFTDGASTIGTASITGAVASLSTSSLAQGSHSLAATYAGDASNAASTAATVTVVVGSRASMTWQYGYDAVGRINTAVDPNGQATYYYYDSLGRRIQMQQPPNTGSSTPTVTQMAYNLGDGLTGVTDPRSLTTAYTPTGLGNVTSETSPDRGGLTYTYDAKGNVLTSTDARGKTTTYTWDSLDRLTSISYPTGTGTAFTYDGAPSPTPAEAGELTKMTDESGQTTWAHDSMGRLTTKTVTTGSKTFTVGYAWGDSGSALDKLTAITYPSGSRVNYTYDSAGMISGITVNPVNANGVGVSSTAVTLLSAITYNADNNPTGWLWSGGKARTIGYDSNGLMSSYTLGDPTGTGNKAGLLRTVNRDAAGRITGYTHTNNGTAQSSLDQTFAYDNLDRLTVGNVAGTNTSYSYDATGNRTSKTVGATTFANTIASNSNRLTAFQDVGGTAVVTYDAAGHMTGDGTNTYAYNDRGRMTSATTPGGTVSYLYNGANQRASKSGSTAIVPGGAGFFVYDEAGQLLGEYDASGKPVYETAYSGSTPVGVLRQTGSAGTNDIAVTVYNVHVDQINAPRVITAQDQTLVWRWDATEAFGAGAPDQNPSSVGVFAFNQRFPGQVFDAETGLNQNWNREYNARTGRYIQSDPIGLAGGVNTFSYVGGSPLSLTDPRGLNPLAGAFNGGRFGAAAGSAFGPVGTVAGGLLGAGVGAAIGWYITGPMLQDKTPNAGEPGSWHTNPGSGQERLYGPDGRPAVDIDWEHDHENPDGTSAGSPHGHNWDWSQKPPRNFPVPISPWPRGRTCPAS